MEIIPPLCHPSHYQTTVSNTTAYPCHAIDRPYLLSAVICKFAVGDGRARAECERCHLEEASDAETERDAELEWLFLLMSLYLIYLFYFISGVWGRIWRLDYFFLFVSLFIIVFVIISILIVLLIFIIVSCSITTVIIISSSSVFEDFVCPLSFLLRLKEVSLTGR